MNNDSEPSEERLAALCARFNAAPFYQTLGLRAESPRPGQSRVTLENSPRLHQAYGGVHGGAILALADSAISIALVSLLADGESTATTELSLTFVAPVGQDDLVACGEVTKKGGRLAFGRCEIFSGERLVATGQGVWFIGDKSRFDRNARDA